MSIEDNPNRGATKTKTLSPAARAFVPVTRGEGDTGHSQGESTGKEMPKANGLREKKGIKRLSNAQKLKRDQARAGMGADSNGSAHLGNPASSSFKLDGNASSYTYRGGKFSKANQKSAQTTTTGTAAGRKPQEKGQAETNRRSLQAATSTAGEAADGTQAEHKHVLPVPKPSQEYLAVCREGFDHLPEREKKLLILDLNGTLIYRSGRYNQKDRVAHLRPGLSEFMTWALDHDFCVLIWSSATPHSVRGMCKVAFSEDVRSRLTGVWARDTLNLTPEQYGNKVQTYKNLQVVWDAPSVRAVKAFSQRDTVIIDDSRSKVAQHPYNHIFVPEFDRHRHDAGNDDVLDQVQRYLELLSCVDNVSAYMKQYPLEVVDEAAPDPSIRPATEAAADDDDHEDYDDDHEEDDEIDLPASNRSEAEGGHDCSPNDVDAALSPTRT
ncbi:hypothetical protein PYCC9005_004347 [Savitreella phatthalungensis]